MSARGPYAKYIRREQRREAVAFWVFVAVVAGILAVGFVL